MMVVGQIGFVSHNSRGVDWVRSVKTAFGCWRFAVGRAEIGFVSYFLAVGFWRLAVGLVELGSFRIFGVGRAAVGANWVRFA